MQPMCMRVTIFTFKSSFGSALCGLAVFVLHKKLKRFVVHPRGTRTSLVASVFLSSIPCVPKIECPPRSHIVVSGDWGLYDPSFQFENGLVGESTQHLGLQRCLRNTTNTRFVVLIITSSRHISTIHLLENNFARETA
jgi:hypothetical protein